MAGAVGAPIFFRRMTEAELRQYVGANLTSVNEWDQDGITLLYTVFYDMRSLSLVLRLLDEKGADVNRRSRSGNTALHGARSLDILNALLDRGADPTLLNIKHLCPLLNYTNFEGVDRVARLLQDPRVRATVDMRYMGETVLHFACFREDDDETVTTSIVHVLLQAGASPIVIDDEWKTPLAVLQERHPTYTTTIALLEQALAAAEVTSLLVKTRRLVVATNFSMTPPYLQGRVAQGTPLPRVTLVCGNQRAKKRRKFCSMLGFILGMRGGPKDEGIPRDVFRGVLTDLLMPVWDPLRQKPGDAGEPRHV